MKMESRLKPVAATNSNGKVTKKYCDKQFKKHLVKALILNSGEPENMEKIRGNRFLTTYPPSKIIEYVNLVSSNVQKLVEHSITEPEVTNVFELTELMSLFNNNEKPLELSLMLKLKSESETPVSISTNEVDFKKLNRFIYTAVSGLPDYTMLSEHDKKVLFDTHEMLMEQVDNDATPEFLEDLKLKICAGPNQVPHPSISNLSEIFQDTILNPLNLPFEYLLNGTLPQEENNESSADSNQQD